MLFVLPKGVINLAGRKDLGELTPQSIIRVTTSEGAVWRCLCSCGQTRDVPAKNLTSGRVTRCVPCANTRRAAQLKESHSQAAGRRGDSNSAFQRHWQTHLSTMSDEQRAVYEDFIERRRRMNQPVTDGVRASAVEAAMIMTGRRAA